MDDDPDASFLDLHMYMTSALRKSDVKAVGLQMALELMHEKSNKDVITGLKVCNIMFPYLKSINGQQFHHFKIILNLSMPQA